MKNKDKQEFDLCEVEERSKGDHKCEMQCKECKDYEEFLKQDIL